MSWTIRWHLQRIDSAAQRLATLGEGEIRRIRTAFGIEHRLLLPPYFVRISRDRASRTLHVWRIVRYA